MQPVCAEHYGSCQHDKNDQHNSTAAAPHAGSTFIAKAALQPFKYPIK